MSKTLEGMARAYTGAWDLLGVELEPSDRMRAALLWLADNVSDEMGCALLQHLPDTAFRADVKSAISAALRAAAED